MITLLILAAWFVCAVAAYFLLRADARAMGVFWSTGTRNIFIGFSLFGPFAMFIGLILLVVCCLGGDEESSW